MTRAQVYRDSVKIRLALDETGPKIAEILRENGVDPPGCDWSRVFPHWLIATVDLDVIGCVMVIPAKPFAFCEFLHVKKSVAFKLRAIAIRKLVQQAIATAHHFGASYVACTVHESNKRFSGVIEKLGVVKMPSVSVYAKRLK